MTCNFVLGKWILAPMSISNETEFNEYFQVGVAGSSHCSTNYGRNQSRKKKYIYFRCNYKTVLNYIHNEFCGSGVYVVYRANQIRENSSISQWQYVPSNMNFSRRCH